MIKHLKRVAKSLRYKPPRFRDLAYQVIPVSNLLYQENVHPGLEISLLPKELLAINSNENSLEFAAASVLDRIVLAALFRKYKPLKLFEIGTFRGVTAVTMAANALPTSILYTLDLPKELDAKSIASKFYSDNPNSGFHQLASVGVSRDVGILLENYQGLCCIEQIYDNSAEMDFAPFQGEIDFFFVDGCHTYDMAKKDTLTAWQCLKNDGIIVWHDFPWSSVQSAIRDARLDTTITFVQDTNIAFAQKQVKTNLS